MQSSTLELINGLVSLVHQQTMPDVGQEAMEALLVLHRADNIELWNPEAVIETFWDVRFEKGKEGLLPRRCRNWNVFSFRSQFASDLLDLAEAHSASDRGLHEDPQVASQHSRLPQHVSVQTPRVR